MSFLKGRSGEQTKNFLSSFWRLPPAPPSAFRKVRKFLGLLRARYRARHEARHHALQGVRRSTKPPRAPRGTIIVKSKFERELVFLHRVKLPVRALEKVCMSYKIYQKNTLDNKVKPLMYEVNMLNNAFDLYWKIYKADPVLPSLILESFLLHARILIDFIEDNRKSKDDLTCSDFVDNDNKSIQGVSVNLKSDTKKALNKHLTHLTQTRLAVKPGWNITDIKYSINGAMEIFINKCADSNFPDNPSMWRSAFNEQLSR